MATEVQKKKVSSGALAAANALKGSLQKVKSALPETRGSGFMSFGKDGIWTFGAANEEVFDDDLIAINPLAIETGFICWTDRGESGPKNEVLGEVMVKLGGDVPLKHTLPQKEDDRSVKLPEWREQIKLTMRFMSGPNKDTQVSYATTSLGGIDACRGLIDQLLLQLDEDPANIVPMVTLDSDHYTHKKWGKTYTPVIRIKSWASLDADAQVDEEEEEEQEAPKVEKKAPAKRTRKPVEEIEEAEMVDVEPEQEEEPEEAPRRERTRRR